MAFLNIFRMENSVLHCSVLRVPKKECSGSSCPVCFFINMPWCAPILQPLP